MSDISDVALEPSKPHRCMHYSSEGIQCRAFAMRNEYSCFHHRINQTPTIVSSDPFELACLEDRASIQKAVAQVAALVALKQIDDRRASLLLYAIQIASCNLTQPPGKREAQPVPTPPRNVDLTPLEDDL